LLQRQNNCVKELLVGSMICRVSSFGQTWTRTHRSRTERCEDAHVWSDVGFLSIEFILVS